MSNNNISNSLMNESSAKVSAKEMFFKYLVYLPLFIISLATTVTIAYIYIRYKVPIYSSSVSLLIKDPRNGSGTDDNLLDDVLLYKKRNNLANEIEILKSATMMERVVKSLGLNVQYYTEGKVKKSEIYDKEALHAEILNMV